MTRLGGSGAKGSWVRHGAGVLSGLEAATDDLQQGTGVPLTARRRWLQCWLDSRPDLEPWLVGVDGEREGELAALALLARDGRRVVAGGDGPSDAVAFAARDERSARVLADRVADELGRMRAPSLLALRRVVAGDPVVVALTERLRRTTIVTGDVSPALLATRGNDLREYVTTSHHRGINRIRNRMVREHMSPTVRHVEDPTQLRELLPDVERIFRARDRDVGRACALDHPHFGPFFRRVYDRHADAGEVMLTVLWLRDVPAAYVLCFVDRVEGRDPMVRMWNCRFDPALSRLSPGKLAIDESVRQAVTGGAAGYDFMRGDEQYKASYATERTTAWDFVAASDPVSHLAVRGGLAARRSVRRLYEQGGRGAVAVDASRRLRDRWRR